MSMSEKNILSYFKETKERVSSKRIKLDETLIESTTESVLSSSKLFTEIVPKPSKSCTETVSSSAKPCTEDVVKEGKKIRQISIKEAFSKIKTIVPDESNQEVDHFKNLEGTPRHHIEPCNNRKRKVDIEATPGYGGSVISSLPRPLKNGTPSSAKKRLVMSPDDEKVNEERDGGADVVSTKGPVSPPRTPVEVHIARINCTPEPTKTPVKRVSAIQDVKSPRAKQLFGSPPKKLDPADVKAKLGKVGKLSDLQARLASVVNENLPKLHAFRQAQKEKQAKLTASDKKNLSKFDSLDLEVPVSPRKVESPRKVQPSPVKSDSPAYDKFWQLKEPGVPTLALPFKFKLLTEIFRCMDVVCSFMYNRQELITFKKLKAGVQQMLRRDFSKNHVRQIVAVYPDSYAISYEKVQLRFATPTKDENQMVITPIIEKKIGGPSVSEKGKEVSNIQKLEFRPMPPTTMVERRTLFQSKLLAIVKEHHAEYLASLIPPMHIPDDKLTRWHPCFLLDEVPDIDPEKYPESPVKQKLGSAKDILESAKSLLGRNPRILGVFESAAKREELAAENLKKGPEPLKSEEVFDTVNPALKGLPKALVDKIRTREAEKIKIAMTQNPEEMKASQMASRLPELARVIYHIFVTDKKPALIKDLLCKRIVEGSKLIQNHSSVEEHIKLLEKVSLKWLTIHQLQAKTFVKINMKADINAVVAVLEKYKKSCV